MSCNYIPLKAVPILINVQSAADTRGAIREVNSLTSIWFECPRTRCVLHICSHLLPGWVLGGKYVNAFSLQKVPLNPDFLCLSGRIRKEGK